MNNLENRVINLIEEEISLVLNLLQDLEEYTSRHMTDVADKCHIMSGFYDRTEKIKDKITNSLSSDLASLRKNRAV